MYTHFACNFGINFAWECGKIFPHSKIYTNKKIGNNDNIKTWMKFIRKYAFGANG